MEVCIAAGLLCRNGRFLLGKRSARRRAYPGVWDLPGGHVEAGETIEQALVRELCEELGATPTEWQELAVLRAPAVSDDRADMLRLHVFLVTAWCGEPRNLLPDEHDAIAWVTADDATGLMLAHAAYPALFRRAPSSFGGYAVDEPGQFLQMSNRISHENAYCSISRCALGIVPLLIVVGGGA